MSLPDGLGYLMRPVLAGLCSLTSLGDGTLSLAEVELANQALDVQAENERRHRESLKDG